MIADWFAQHSFVVQSFVAGLAASVACGIGALPLAFPGLRLEYRIGLGYAFAAGLMFSASVYNLLLPALTVGSHSSFELVPVLKTLAGMGLGAAFLGLLDRSLTPERLERGFLRHTGGRMEALVFAAMAFHSIPEGIAVGVGYGSESHLMEADGFGHYIAIAIGIHNIPEGLAVALPMRLRGASMPKVFLFAFLSSLPQPIAAVPAAYAVWLFEPLMLPFLGFAAGAMIHLVIKELVPESLESHSRTQVSWMFLAGFGLMVLVQVGL